MIREKLQLDAQLQLLHQQALEDSALSAEQDQLIAAVRSAISLPMLQSMRASTFDAILVEAQAAQQASDAASDATIRSPRTTTAKRVRLAKLASS